MDVPNITVNHVEYSVQETDKPLLLHGRECTGTINFDDLLIKMKAALPFQRKRQTLMHEIVHAIACELNIKEIEDSEDITELLGIALADTLARNKWIVEDAKNN